MDIAKGTLLIKCTDCHRQHDFAPNDTSFESSYTKNRGEGMETGYAWTTDFDCDCGNKIEIDYKVYEFPIGDFNADELKISGANIVSKFGFDFEREPDFYE